MSRAFTIRPTGPDDIDALMRLVRESWARTYDPIIGEAERLRISGAKHVRALFESEYADPAGFGFVASDGDGRLVADKPAQTAEQISAHMLAADAGAQTRRAEVGA